ncbi:MAG: ABC transporter permease [Thermoplasmata archaeon]|nr:MAG: ABC transporter permease [Thermoplasmata archaeon]
MKKFFINFGNAVMVFYKTITSIFTKRIEWDTTLEQIVKIGNESLPLVILCGAFTGMVFALQVGETSISIFNEPIYIGLSLAYSLVLELGPVLTSLVVTGRAGAAMTAEIGTMKVTEQIDALYTLGSEPISYIFVPRFNAFFVSLPILVLFADCSGILGGLVVAKLKLGYPISKYWEEIRTLGISTFSHGILKSFVFALLIVWIACYNGIETKGGAEGVGKATTKSVVVSMVFILVTDYFLTSLLLSFGIV